MKYRISILAAVCLAALQVHVFSAEPQGGPLDDAVAVWHMADLTGRGGTAGQQLALRGDVAVGVPLEGADRKASLARGGDGHVAQFDGGYLIAGEGAPEALHLSGDKMTFCIRLRDLAGKWDAPLFARHAPDDELGKILYAAPLNTHTVSFPAARRIKEGKSIEFLWRTTPLKQRVHQDYLTQDASTNWFKFLLDWEAKNTPARKGDFVNGVLRLQAPTELIGADRWHDVVVRFNRANLELFVDGVLLDEDWPHGNLHQFQGPFLIGAGFQDGKLLSGFHGQIDHAALWDRALTDAEIAALSGGAEETARRDVEILGPPENVTQYWRPRGYNTFVGDCMAFSHDGTFHLFYLYDRRHCGGKWGMGAHQYGHATTKDLVRWEHHPMALQITEPWECSLGTGSCVYHEGKYHLFYIHHGKRAWYADAPYLGDSVFVATSDDGIHFKKNPQAVVAPQYSRIGDVNPDVYRNETDGGFLLSLSNWKVWASKDLKHWEERANLASPKWWICTSYFKWNDWYYFSSCGRFRKSRRPIESGATWNDPPHQTLADGVGVPEVAALNDRYILVGFVEPPPDAYYAAELVFREMVQHEDGTLGSKWPVEMIPNSGGALKLPFEVSKGDASAEGNAIRVSAPDGFSVGTLADVPQNVRITLRVKPQPGAKQFGLCFHGAGNYEKGCELRFEPGRHRVDFHSFGVPAAETARGRSIGMGGLDRAFTLDVSVKGDLVDACIDNRRTTVRRHRAGADDDRLFLFARNGSVSFEDIQVRPLLPEKTAEGDASDN